MILNKKPNLTQYISLTLKSIFYAYPDLWDLCTSSVLHLGELTECASTEEDVKTVLSCCQSRNACVNISVPVKLLGKSSASLWVFFSEPQTSSARPPRAERHLKICAGDLKGRGGALCGDLLLVWQQIRWACLSWVAWELQSQNEVQENSLQEKHAKLSSQV